MSKDSSTETHAQGQSETFNPYTHFQGHYLSVLYSTRLPDVLTCTEKTLLKYFHYLCFEDGGIYPKQTTIAAKIGRCTQQVGNLLKSLEKKGFIYIERVNMLERHILKKTNHYHFVWNAIYEEVPGVERPAEISENSSCVEGPISDENFRLEKNSFIEETQPKQIISPPAVGSLLADSEKPKKPTAEDRKIMADFCKQLMAKQKRFNADQFTQQQLKNYVPSGVIATLKKLAETMAAGIPIRDWWAFGLTEIKKVGQMHNEAAHIRQHRDLDNELYPAFLFRRVPG